MNDAFTIEELLAALEAARTSISDDPAAMTIRQLREITGHGEVTMARQLRTLIEAGRVVCVRIPFVRIDGTQTTVPAYKLVGVSDDDDGGGKAD